MKEKKINRKLLLQIAQLGHPSLRKKSLPVLNIKDPQIQNLIDNMIVTVMDGDGVGIAAPQVYQQARIFILASHPTSRYPDAPTLEPEAIINPKIIFRSDDIVKDWEGCLSIPGIRGLIPRYESIKVEYTARDGEKINKNLKGFLARIFQHEYDHLDGLVFLDRLEINKDIISEKEYQRMIKKEKEKKRKKTDL